jgi:hypothetical protein
VPRGRPSNLMTMFAKRGTPFEPLAGGYGRRRVAEPAPLADQHLAANVVVVTT